MPGATLIVVRAAGGARPRRSTAAGGTPVMDADAEDAVLVARLGHGDAAAFAALYDRHAAQVHAVARAILRDDGLAEEATHDVFLGLWRQPEAFAPARGRFVAWLLRLARNRAIDLRRRRRERPFAVALGGEGEPAPNPADRLVDPAPDPADQVVSRFVGQEVRAALARLSPDHRRLLELAYFGGLTQREIAARLDRPLGTVKTQIRTAMQRLADLLEGSVLPQGTETGDRPR